MDETSAMTSPQRGGRPAGRLAAIWRYPLKSTLGEAIIGARVSARGLHGDRVLALVDGSTGRVGSAKHPRVWGRLLEIRSSFMEPRVPGAAPRVRLQLADGSLLASDDPDCRERLCDLLGRQVELVATPPEQPMIERYSPVLDERADGQPSPGETADTSEARTTLGPLGAAAPPGTFFDFAPLHLITSATMEALQRLHPAGRMDTGRFRPNLVIQTAPDEPPFAEDRWIGRTLAIGAEVVVSITHPTPRCVITTLAQGDLSHDLDVLRTIARHHQVEIPGLGRFACAGVYAQIAREGEIRINDPVRMV